jgi:hypothetical protein
MAKMVGWYISLGWTDKLPFYQFKCEKCNLTVINHPQTNNELLLCPICQEREWQTIDEETKQRAKTAILDKKLNHLKHSEPILIGQG